MTSVSWQSALIVAPVLSGFLYVGSPTWPFIAAAVFAIVATFSTLLIKVQWGRIGPKMRRSRRPFTPRSEGLRLIRRTPILFGAISLDLFAVLFGGAVALLPAIAEDRLGRRRGRARMAACRGRHRRGGRDRVARGEAP